MQFGSLLYSEYFCKSYNDDDNKSDRNTLVINNMWKNTYFIHVHLLVSLHKFKYAFNVPIGGLEVAFWPSVQTRPKPSDF